MTNCSSLWHVSLTLQWYPFLAPMSSFPVRPQVCRDSPLTSVQLSAASPIISVWKSQFLFSWMWPHHSHPQRGRRADRMWHRLDRMSEASRPAFSASPSCWLIWSFRLLFFLFFILAGIKWQLCGRTTKMWISGAAGCLSGDDVTTHLLSRSDRVGSLLFWWGNANELNCSWGYLAGVE